MKNKVLKRTIALWLCIVMVLGSGMSALATEETPSDSASEPKVVSEEPAEQPEEKKEEKPAEEPAEQPAEKPAEQPAEQEQSAESEQRLPLMRN